MSMASQQQTEPCQMRCLQGRSPAWQRSGRSGRRGRQGPQTAAVCHTQPPCTAMQPPPWRIALAPCSGWRLHGQAGRWAACVLRWLCCSLVVLHSWHSIKGPCCAALRPALLLLPFNLMAHDGPSVDDQQALHALASLSNLTRWL